MSGTKDILISEENPSEIAEITDDEFHDLRELSKITAWPGWKILLKKIVERAEGNTEKALEGSSEREREDGRLAAREGNAIIAMLEGGIVKYETEARRRLEERKKGLGAESGRPSLLSPSDGLTEAGL